MAVPYQTWRIFIGFCLVLCSVRVVTSEKDKGVTTTITRVKHGDLFTKRLANGRNDSYCESWFARNIVPYSKDNCSVLCKCNESYSTFSVELDRCSSDFELLKFYNCSGPLSMRPLSDTPLYDLTKPGRARFAAYLNNYNASLYNCTFTVIEARKSEGEDQAGLLLTFNVMKEGNWLFLVWPGGRDLRNASGRLLKVVSTCDVIGAQGKMTSQEDSCMLMKSRGSSLAVNYNEKSTRDRGQLFCGETGTKEVTNGMLIYILIGVGIGLAVIVILVGIWVCFYRKRRRLDSQQRSSSVSRSRVVDGSRRTFKNWSSSSKREAQPATPAIHEVIFNGLIWDGDGGFSNHAIADPRFFEVDYGIPIDSSNSFPRPQSIASKSTRNSMAPLTPSDDNSR